MSENFVVISGCSGGGKSTLLDELARRGKSVVSEPGRRVVSAELAGDGKALPWIDLAAFARKARALALEDRARATALPAPVFFDRGIVDALAALDFAMGTHATSSLGQAHRYHRRVFMAPPWPEIWQTDAERRHDFAAATDEFDRLVAAYTSLGYTLVMLDRAPVAARADQILACFT